jgi:hypothetical protein
MGWLILALLVLAGCGKKEGTVEGKVSVDGTPITSGSVFFTRADGGEARAIYISSNGTYRALNIAPGPVKVCVTPLPSMDRKKKVGSKEMEAPPQPPVPIPKKYTHADTSGLSTTVHSGTNTYDIEMSSR